MFASNLYFFIPSLSNLSLNFIFPRSIKGRHRHYNHWYKYDLYGGIVISFHVALCYALCKYVI